MTLSEYGAVITFGDVTAGFGEGTGNSTVLTLRLPFAVAPAATNSLAITASISVTDDRIRREIAAIADAAISIVEPSVLISDLKVSPNLAISASSLLEAHANLTNVGLSTAYNVSMLNVSTIVRAGAFVPESYSWRPLNWNGVLLPNQSVAVLVRLKPKASMPMAGNVSVALYFTHESSPCPG